VEVLLLEPLDDTHREWEALIRPGRKMKPSEVLYATDNSEALTVLGRGTKGDTFRVSFVHDDPASLIARLGEMPLPPYITQRLDDSTRYQTVYAREAKSAAAPTAGLHFTPELLQNVQATTQRAPAFVTLEVGMGTFKPIETPRLADHVMHCERFSVSAATLDRLVSTRPNGRLVVVGTTTVRALESLPSPLPKHDFSGESRLFIQPGYQFKHVDALLTNFHLPRSTLLSLVGALIGLERLKSLYALAQSMDYRFYSYGDAMLIL